MSGGAAARMWNGDGADRGRDPASGAATEADLALAVYAALRAGPAAMRRFGRDADVRYKSPDQPFTEADLAADRVIGRTIREARPHDGWLSEESADRPDRLARDRVWIVDPIDGTRSYIAARPEFAICVGLAREGVAEVGIVYNPATGELFGARRGHGAWLAMVPDPRRRQPAAAAPPTRLDAALAAVDAESPRELAVGTPDSDDRAVLLASRSEIARGEFDPLRDRWRIEPEGSTAYKMARIAAGGGDAFLSRGPKSEWDVCAAARIVEEAGGRVTDLDGRTLRFNRRDTYVHGVVVASGGRLHDRLLERVRTLSPTGRLDAGRRRGRSENDGRQSYGRGG